LASLALFVVAASLSSQLLAVSDVVFSSVSAETELSAAVS
jgi:hypothetical protein